MTPRPALIAVWERGKKPEDSRGCVVSLIDQGLIGVRSKALGQGVSLIAERDRRAYPSRSSATMGAKSPWIFRSARSRDCPTRS
jgi:hypothetical protein